MQPLLVTLRHRTQKPVLAVVFAAVAMTSGPVSADAFFWDTDTSVTGNDPDGTNLGGSGTWDTSTGQWWDLSSLIAWPNSGTDQAIFSYAYPGLGIPVQNTVTVDAGGVNAGRISFLRSGYTLSGGAITLAGATPTLHATLGDSATISSNLLGAAGLTKTGGGTIRLSGDNSGLTGPLSILNGSLSFNSALALPGTGAVSILTNNATPSNTNQIGFYGGSLILDGLAGGFTLSRDINLEGRGPLGDRGSAILSLGDNTLSGTITSGVSPLVPATFRSSRLNSVNGTLNLTGALVSQGTSASTFLALGGINSAGIGNYNLSGSVSGTGSIEKSGAGTLFWNPSTTSTFNGTLRISGSATTGHQSSVRITQATVGGASIFGNNAATTTSSAIDLNGGVLEFRSDSSLNFGALSTGKNVYTRSTGSIFTGPAAGGAGIDGVTTLGALHQNASGTGGTNTTTLNSRNGYGVTFSTLAVDASTSSSTITTNLANNLGGDLTFTGNLTMPEGSTASRPRIFAFGGNGNSVVLGSIIAGTDVGKVLTKTGSGNLTIAGTASTLAGPVNINGGAITITDFRSIGNNTSAITLGNTTTTAGNLIIGGVGTPTPAGLTTTRPIILNGTTAGNSIVANQTGLNPVVLNGAFTKPIAGNATFTLAGTNEADNIINVGIPSLGTSGVTKVGSGTWVLGGANLYTGATTISNGTLKLRANAASSTALPATNALTFGATSGFAGGTFELVGQSGVNNVQNLGTLSYATAGANTIRVTPGVGGSASLTFANVGTGGGGTLNIVGADFTTNKVSLTQVNASVGADGIVTRSIYWDGADFAYRQGGVLRAPNYGVDAGTSTTAAGPLTTGSNSRISGSFSTGAVSIATLKIDGAHTLTVTSGNLTLSAGGLLATGGDSEITGAGALALGSQVFVVRVNGENDNLLLSTASITGTGGLTKSGEGTLTIATSNARTGTTEIAEGTVRLSGTGTLSGANVTTNIRQGAFLDLNGVGSGTAIGQFNNMGEVTNNSDTDATLTIGNNNGTGTSYGIISDGTGTGIVNVTKVGSGAQSWLGNSTYTGVTTIGSSGQVTVNTLADGGIASGIGASSGVAANLVFDGTSGGLIYQGSILNGTLTLGSRSATTDRLFTISGSGATLSSTVSNNNAIVWSNMGAILHGTDADRTLTLTGTSAGDNTFNPQLTNSTGFVTSLSKTNTGQWNLGNSNNTYTGTTSVANGILALNDNGALPANSPVVLGATTTSGILQMSGTLSRNLATTATAGSGTVTWGGTTGGGGFASHTTPLTVTLNGGSGLTWAAGGFVGAGSLNLNSASALSSVDFTNAIALNPGSVSTPTVTTSDASANVSTSDTAGLIPGQTISGPGIPAGAVIVSITNGTTFVISANATTALGAGTGAASIGLARRTITVNDNANTGADFATMSGVISGAGGFQKAGAGVLRLTGANTYTGVTDINTGTLVVRSLGNSGDAPNSPTSVGVSGVTFDNSNAITLGNASTGGAVLQYVGAGETSDRKIRFNSTTGGAQIHADGSGPLILTNVVNDFVTPTGAKTLNLRGTNTAGNMITSALSNDGGGGVLSVTVDGGATWILTNGANSYTGATTVGSGALGIGHNTAIPGTLTISNGNVFAYGGDRTMTNTLNMGNNASSGFIGDYNLTFNGTNNLAATDNNLNLYNSIAPGKKLTFNGLLANSLTATRALAYDGTGETVINGNFTTTTGFGVNITQTGNGILTLGTNGALSNWNQANNAIDIDRGTLKFSANEAIPTTFGAVSSTTSAGVPVSTTTYTVASTAGLQPGQTFSGTNVPSGSRILTIDSPTTFTTTIAPTTAVASGVTLTFAASGGLTISPEVLTTDTATVDLNGTNQTVNALSATTDGTVVIDNTSATAATFRFGANNSTVAFGTGTGTYTVQNTGAGALSLVKLGNTTTTFGTGLTLGHKGVTASEGGGVFNIASALTATSGLRATGASTLSLTGGIINPNLITSIEVGGGSTLSLLDGAGSVMSNLASLSLGAGTGAATLNLNVGDSATDSFTLLTGGALTLNNSVIFNLTDAGLSANTTYTLLNLIDGGITAFGASNMIQGAIPGGFDSFTWNVNDNVVQLTTGNLLLNDLYWRGSTSNVWNGALNNWSTDKAGTVVASSIPGQGNKVIFAYDGVGAGALTTELGQNFKINSLVFEAGTTTPASVTINPGSLTPNARLEIAPSVSSNGIAISAGGPAAVNIASALKLGADQTWNVADASTVLNLSGPFSGEADVVKNGSGRVIISGVADPTFNTGQTSVFTVEAGNLELANSAALGTTLNTNVAGIVINGGAYYYNNATAGTAATLPHAMTLNGGVLSAGGNNHIYGGPVAITGNSGINMADSNGPAANAARSITLSGIVSGTGNLTIDSNSTVSSGNQLGGTLTLNNAANTWSGDLLFNEGTVVLTNAASPTFTTNDVTFNAFGRLNFQGLNASTLTRSGTLTYAAGAIGELGVDNTGAVVNSDYLVDQAGAVTLGTGGTGANVRIFLTDAFSKMNISGGVTLGGNSSISVGGDAAGVATISGVISDGGSGYGLAINDDAGGWATTNRIARLTGANTFTGNISLAEGVLEFTTVTDISGGASSLGNGTAINMNGGILRFVGTSPQSTNRPINTGTAAINLSANGATAADKITYNGNINITSTANGSLMLLSGATGREGVIAGGITQSGDATDMTVNGGTWTHQTGTSRVGDDLAVSGTGTIFNLDSGLFQVRDDVSVTTGGVLNLNGAGVLSFNTATLSVDASLRAQNGGVINFGANNAVLVTDFDGLRAGVDDVGIGTINMQTFNQTAVDFILGNRNLDRSGLVNGTGVITATGNIDLYGGTVNAGLATSGAVTLDKVSLNTVTLAGDNSGLTGTGNTVISEGTLILDYTTSNATKVNSATAIDMRGANLILNGNAAASTSQTVNGLNLASGGSSVITLNPGAGQSLVLNLNGITRATNAQDGTIRFNLPAGTQSATNGITTDILNTVGTGANAIIGGWATVSDSTGAFFARNATNAVDGNIVIATTTLQDATGSWVPGENISDSSGFTGVISNAFVNSLRFNAVAGSDLSLAGGGVLGINSGGILVTDNVGGTPSIMNGTLFSAAVVATPELFVTQDSAADFEIGSDIRINHQIIKTGSGVLQLSGNNVYSGLTEIQNGTLRVSGGNAIGDSSLVTLSVSRSTTLELLNDETIGRLQGGSRQTGQDHGTVAIGANTLTINQSGNTTFSGFFTGNGSIVLNNGSTGNLNMNNVSSGFTGSVVVNGGLFQLSGVGRNDASSFTINNAGNLLIDKNGTTTSGTQILDTASITLNSAIGTAAQPGGLWIRRDQGSTQTETVGTVTAGSGSSYIRTETSVASAVAVLSAGNVLRENNATLVIRGNAMAATSGRRSQFRIIAANEAAFISSMVGGGSAAGTVTTSIVPWAVAEDIVAGGTIGAGNMGNSLVTYTPTTGFRPLSFASEYASFGTGGATNNTRESLTGDLTLQSGRTLNSLVINNQAITSVSLTGAGSGNSLTNTSGAFLFTLEGGAPSTAYATGLSGFDDGIFAPGGEYIFHVVNPSLAATTSLLTATVSSLLASSSDITKSGRGTLILDQINTAGGGAKKTTINEGTLEIADLDNIGGDTGGLVFAGGTLRLGAFYGTDDLTSRAISFLVGGGTLDTNGKDPVFAGSLGSGVGGFTKTGGGNLTLNGSATYTGSTVISLGTVTVGANNALGNGGNLTLAAGTTLAFSGSNSLTHGLVTTSGASPQITGTGTINASSGFFFNHTGDTTINAVLGGAGGLLKGQTNILTLGGLNTYTGTTEIQNGGVIFNSIANVGGGSSSFGAPTTVENGIIRLGLTTANITLNYTGSGHTTDRIIGLQGSTGSTTLDADGTGALILGNIRNEQGGNKTITLRGSSDASLENAVGQIRENGAVISLLKTDTNTWAYNQSQFYSGATTVDNGILRLKAVQNLTGALQFGSANTITTTGTLEVKEDAAFGSLLAQTNGAANMIIDPTKEVTINGNVVIGNTAAAATVTNLIASGGGDFVVNNIVNTGNTFNVGTATATTNNSLADFSALASMTVSLNPTGGTMLVSSASGTNSTGKAELRLADTTVVTANAITVGGGGNYNGNADQVNLLKLGTVSNTLNVNALNIGTGARDLGSITFLDTAGTLTVRAADGTSATAFNMGTGSANTAVGAAGNQNIFDVTGHTADLKFGAVNIGTQNRNSDLVNVFSFDTGTLEIGSLVASTKGSNGSTTTTTINLGGGTVTTGAWTLATASGAGTAVATANLTGGNITFSGAITRGADAAGGGTATGTVNLNGAVLDMGGNAIGTATNQIVFNAQSGTLRNLSELNGGGTLDKTTAGTLILDTANSYTGTTTVTAGVLRVSHGNALGGTTAGTSVADGAVLELSGGITTAAEGLTLNGSGISSAGALRNVSGDNTYTGNITLATASRINSDAGILNLDAATGPAIASTNQNLTLGGSGSIAVADAINLGTGNLVKDGTGTVILSGDNNYTGTTTVSDGLLQVNGDSSLATGAVTVASGATLGGSGTIGGAASTATIASGGTLTGGSDGSSGTVGVLDPLVTDAVDSLSFGGSLTASTGSIWLVDLVQGGTSDLINVGGGLDITGANLVINFGGAFVVDQVYTIATYGTGLTGTFQGLGEGAFVDPGNLYRINYGTLGAGGAITLTAVPEPGTLGFLGLALSGFFVRRIRRRRAVAAAAQSAE